MVVTEQVLRVEVLCKGCTDVCKRDFFLSVSLELTKTGVPPRTDSGQVTFVLHGIVPQLFTYKLELFPFTFEEQMNRV